MNTAAANPQTIGLNKEYPAAEAVGLLVSGVAVAGTTVGVGAGASVTAPTGLSVIVSVGLIVTFEPSVGMHPHGSATKAGMAPHRASPMTPTSEPSWSSPQDTVSPVGKLTFVSARRETEQAVR